MVPRVGRRPDGQRTRGFPEDSRGLRREHGDRDDRRQQRDARVRRRSAAAARRLACSTGAARAGARNREDYGERIYLPQLLLIEGAIAQRARRARCRRRCDPARGSRGSRTRRGLAGTAGADRTLRTCEVRRTRIDARSPCWSSSSTKQARRLPSPGREPCSLRRSRSDLGDVIDRTSTVP